MGRSSKFVAVGFGVLAALLATDANAVDCAGLTKSTRAINMAVTGKIDGGPLVTHTIRVERGARTLVTVLAPDGRVNVRMQFEGVVARWTETYPAGTLSRWDYQYVNAQGSPASLEEGATASWELRSIADGKVTLVVDERQTVGSHGSTTLSGCTVATVAVHQDLLNKAIQGRATIDWLFAPELGYWIACRTKREMASAQTVREEVFTATSVELGE